MYRTTGDVNSSGNEDSALETTSSNERYSDFGGLPRSSRSTPAHFAPSTQDTVSSGEQTSDSDIESGGEYNVGREEYLGQLERARVAGMYRKPRARRSSPKASSGTPKRNVPLSAENKRLPQATFGGVEWSTGETVRLKKKKVASLGKATQDLFRVVENILNTHTGSLYVYGYRFRHVSEFDGIFGDIESEFVMVLDVDEDDDRPDTVQGLESVPIHEIESKCEMHLISEHNIEEVEKFLKGQELFCRRKWITKYDDSVHRLKGTRQSSSGASVPIHPNEADTSNDRAPRSATDVSTEQEQDPICKILDGCGYHLSDGNAATSEHVFVSVDGFSGAGGATIGLKAAGMIVAAAFDNNATACETYRANHPEVPLFEVSAQAFPSHWNCCSPHHIHLSTVCKFFSRAKRRVGKNDEANRQTLEEVGRYIGKYRPPYLSLEQVYTLRTHFRRDDWAKMLKSVVRRGYSVAWKELEFLEHEVPAPRKRLIVWAAAPHMPLPPFPPKTCGPPGSGLDAYVSFADALQGLAADATHMDHSKSKPPFEVSYDPYLYYLPRVITTHSCDNLHFSGERYITPRERGCLNTFPADYIWKGTNTAVNTQAGNGFSPKAAEAVFKPMVELLHKLKGGWRPESPPLLKAVEIEKKLKRKSRAVDMERQTEEEAKPTVWKPTATTNKALLQKIRAREREKKLKLIIRPSATLANGLLTPPPSTYATKGSGSPSDPFTIDE